jgi:hypothetical protein
MCLTLSLYHSMHSCRCNLNPGLSQSINTTQDTKKMEWLAKWKIKQLPTVVDVPQPSVSQGSINLGLVGGKCYYNASVIRIKGIKLPHRLGPRSWQRQRRLWHSDLPWLAGSFLSPEASNGCKYLIAWFHLGVVVDGGRSDGFNCRSSLLPRAWRRWTFHVPPRALQG